MRDILPRVTVKTDINSEAFLRRIERIATELNGYEVIKATYDYLDEGSHSLILKYTLHSPHDNLMIHLTTDSKEDSRVVFSLAARKWNPDPPTYEVYVQAVREVIEPLIRKYNRRRGSRRRLTIQSKESTEPTLPPRCARFFEGFLRGAAGRCPLHASDWGRFYLFVRFAHRVSLQSDEHDIKRLLWRAGFSEDYAGEIANVYHHGRSLLKKKLYWYHFQYE